MMSETTNSTAIWAIGQWSSSLTYRLSGVAGEGQVKTRASGRVNTLHSAI